VRILVVDDHAVVRGGLRRLLSERFEGVTFGEAADGPEGVAMATNDSWELVILDLSLPGRSGLEALKEIHATRPKLPVLVMTMHSEEQYAVRAFRAGASGYVMKGAAEEDLVAAVEKTLAGGKYVTPELAEALATTVGGGGGATLPHEALSDRELQVLRMLAAGKTVKDIGAELGLSAKTISTYRTRILEKMRMRTTAQIVRYALASGLVE